VYRLRVVSPDGAVGLALEAPDLAVAASRAIRTAERDGLRVLRVEFPDASAESDGRPTPRTDVPTSARPPESLETTAAPRAGPADPHP
jgi:hypothetical protein